MSDCLFRRCFPIQGIGSPRLQPLAENYQHTPNMNQYHIGGQVVKPLVEPITVEGAESRKWSKLACDSHRCCRSLRGGRQSVVRVVGHLSRGSSSPILATCVMECSKKLGAPGELPIVADSTRTPERPRVPIGESKDAVQNTSSSQWTTSMRRTSRVPSAAILRGHDQSPGT